MARAPLSLDLEKKIANLPERPGVYLMKNRDGHVIYVGKARNLKNRVRTYFHDSSRMMPKVAAMMRHVDDFELITTDTEVEALILEATLVKDMQPHYNIRLKDDKAYPYVRLTWEEDFPRLLIARKPASDGSRYFGPYPRVQAVRDSIRLLRRIFPIRNCTNQKFRNAGRPCLEFHIKRCQAPCQNLVSRDDYRVMIEQVEKFLEGRIDDVERTLVTRLEASAEAMEFERAAELRDQVRAIREVTAQQKTSTAAGRELDAIHWAVAGQEAYVQVFRVRAGRLVGRETLTLTGVDGTDEADIARSFLLQYYAGAPDIPPEVLIPVIPDDMDQVTAWLKERKGGRTEIKVPMRGEKYRLLNMVRHNAELSRDESLRRQERTETNREEALLGLQHTLGLEHIPHRMECYDISNTQGTESVASMVVFTDGKPDKAQYRRFKIRTVQGPNDFASMQEVIGRRFRHVDQAHQQPGMKRFAQTPDLVIIDGGRGQLGYAVKAMQEAGVDVPVFGLAKQHEWLFAPDAADPIILDRDSAALQMLQRLRDEAHRFAITFHRKLRTGRNLRSVLDTIPDVGPKRKRALLAAYPTIEALKEASVEELGGLPGMTRRAAESVKKYLVEDEKPLTEPTQTGG